MSIAIELEGVNKRFGEKIAVDDMNLQVPSGALYGIIGPNGAGKSTTLRMILSILLPDSGRLSVLGKASAFEAKDRIGYLPEERGVYRKMKVGAFLEYMARLKGLSGKVAKPRVAHWLERVGLADVAGKRCEELSKGMQQKVQFIAAVAHEPDLVILDEPFSGLDPVSMRLMRELFLEQHARGATVLFSTHQMQHAEQLCDHIVMIHNGRKVLDDPLASIHARSAPRALLLEPLDVSADVAAALADVAGLGDVSRDEGGWRLALKPFAELGTTVQAVAARVAPLRLEVQRPSLEDLFIEIVTGSAAPGSVRAVAA